MEVLKRFFRLDENRTTVWTETRAGLVTFMTMAYIIFVQPIIMGMAPGLGDDALGSIMLATCLASAAATLMMGLLANYPIALAPAMGHNVFFAVTVCAIMGVAWQRALGAVFIAGVAFMLLSFVGLRERVMNAIPPSLKNAIAVGIGLLIALVGFEHAGLVVYTPGTHIGITQDFLSKPVVISVIGLAVLSVLMAWRVRGAVLITIFFSTVLAAVMGIVELPKGWSMPSLAPTFLKLDIGGAFTLEMIGIIFIFFFLDMFDTIGTLVGVSEQGGFMREGRLPRARRALFSDAFGTVFGSLLGTSTVTSYIESTAGITDGGRTGLSNVTTALLFILAIFAYPVVRMVGGGYYVGMNAAGDPVTLYPITAPVLIMVGSMMMRSVTSIDWKDVTEAVPAFLAIAVMPLTFSITDGIAFGFIAYSGLKLATGRGKEVSRLVFVFSLLFLCLYAIRTLYMSNPAG